MLHNCYRLSLYMIYILLYIIYKWQHLHLLSIQIKNKRNVQKELNIIGEKEDHKEMKEIYQTWNLREKKERKKMEGGH